MCSFVREEEGGMDPSELLASSAAVCVENKEYACALLSCFSTVCRLYYCRFIHTNAVQKCRLKQVQVHVIGNCIDTVYMYVQNTCVASSLVCFLEVGGKITPGHAAQ